MKNVILCLIILSVFAHKGISQDIRYRVQHLTTKDGLSQNWIDCMLKDSRGIMWFGTRDGLNRFDSYNFSTYKNKKSDPNSLSQNNVTCMAEDKDGNIWMGTLNGLNKYIFDGDKFVAYLVDTTDATGYPDDRTLALLFDGPDTLWTGTQSHGLCKLVFTDKERSAFTVQNFDSKPNNHNTLSSNTITNILNYNASTLVVGTDKGINFVDKKSGKAKQMYFDSGNPMFNSNLIHSLCKGADDALYIGTEFGLYVMAPNGKTTQYLHLPEKTGGLPHNTVKAISRLPDGRMVLATLNGLALFTPQTETFEYINASVQDDYHLNNNFIDCALVDERGDLWIGTEKGGVNTIFLDQKPFYSFTVQDGSATSLNQYIVNSIVDTEEVLWIGTAGGGLNRYDKRQKKMSYFLNDPLDPNSISLDFISCLHIDSKGRLWAGTWGSGFNRCTYLPNGKLSFKNYTSTEGQTTGLPSNKISAIRQDPSGMLWITTFGGLALFDPETDRFYRVEPKVVLGAKLEKLADIRITNDNNAWVASELGVFRFKRPAGNDPQKLSAPDSLFFYGYDATQPDGLNGYFIIALAEDKNGSMWFSSLGNGLNKLESLSADGQKATFSHVTQEDGLSNNVIYTILCDDENNLWMSTDNGLCKYSIKTKAVRSYYELDGLLSNQFYWGAAYHNKTTDQMYFGGLKGFNYIKPNEIKDDTVPPDILVTGFKIFNQSVEISEDQSTPISKNIALTDSLVLSYQDDVFSFEFAALNYHLSEKCQFSYQLLGFDDKPIVTDATRRFVSYTNLNPGEYTLVIKATNSDGIWNEKGKSVYIKITPPFWETWWFRTIAILTFIGSGVGFFMYRVNALKRRQKILEDTVLKRTEELRGANLELNERQEEILQQNEEITQQNHEITLQKEVAESQKQEIERAYGDMQRLSEFGQQLTAMLQITEIGSTIYKHISAMLEVDVLGLGVYLPRRNAVDFVLFIEQGKVHPSFMSNLDDPSSLAAWCIKNQQEVHCNDFEKECHKYIKEIKIKSDKTPRSIINVPLIVENRTIGVLSLQCYRTHAFSVKDFTNIRSLASYLSIALDNAKAYQTIEKQNGHIKDSISYAQTIQNAILPTKDFIAQRGESFVLFKPKDIVSGDFYWSVAIPNNTEHRELFVDCPNCSELFFIAAVDCTGHGVPGAFMSMIGSMLLNEIVKNQNVLEPKDILTELDRSIVKSLKQLESNNDDGMDLCLLKIFMDPTAKQQKGVFAGAKLPLYHYVQAQGEIVKIESSRRAIGGNKFYLEGTDYEQTEIVLQQGDSVYLSTDGFADQNNKDRKRLSSTKLISILEQASPAPMAEQLALLDKEFTEFKTGEPQRDDVTLIGLRI